MSEETTLYRHYNEKEELLYIGISYHSGVRGKQHALYSSWWSEVRKSTHEPFPDRESALAAEREAIKKEGPKYNIRLNEDDKRLVEPVLPPRETPAQVSIKALRHRIVNVRGAYTVSSLEYELDMNRTAIIAAIRSGELLAFRQGNGYKVTGWEVLEYLERKEREAKNETP